MQLVAVPTTLCPNSLRTDTMTPPTPPWAPGPCPVITARKVSVRVRVRVRVGCAHACKSATRRRGLTQGCGSVPGRTRAVSACARAQRALPEPGSVPCRSAACRVRVGRTACDRSGMRRVGRARRGDAGLPCLANACREGPSPKARKSCTSCTCPLLTPPHDIYMIIIATQIK